MDTQLALEKVKSGEIAATTLLAGAPVGKYANISADDNLHLVPVNYLNPKNSPDRYKNLLKTFLPATLKHKDYPNLIPEGQTVSTIASSAVLAVYNWPQDSHRYKKLETFVYKFFDNVKKLQVPPRHPKWKSINLAANVPGWNRFKPASEALLQLVQQRDRKKITPSYREFKRFVESSGVARLSDLTDEQRQQFYQNFLDWMKKQ